MSLSNTPRSSDPRAEPTKQRLYQSWAGRNRFYCNGWLMAGPDVKALGITFCLVTVPSILFLCSTSVALSNKGEGSLPGIGAGLGFFFSIIFLFQTALTNPGIIPRAESPIKAGMNPPRLSDVGTQLKRSAQNKPLKYCITCKIYRPPRCVHCVLCDNCVEVFDHHCPWIGTCVGKANYGSFISFTGFLSFQV